MAAPSIRYRSAQGRWVLLATVLGSGIAFLDGTVVNVALPAIEKDFDAGVRGLQWIVNGYLVTESALLLVGGTLGDLYGRRRIYVIGLVVFTGASLLCGVAPSTEALIAARALQGVGAALLVPESLAIISATFHPEDRPTAIGAWSGLSGITTAIGPFVGGWLISAVSWRLVFLINLPLAAYTVWVTLRHVPETRDEEATHAVDVPGAATAVVGLAVLTYGLIERSAAVSVVGIVVLVAFVVVERRARHPMLPLELFRSSQFTGANLATLAVYAALSGMMFLLVVVLQGSHGYSPTEAGASLMPAMLLLLVLSPRMGGLSQRIGPRLPMTAGPLVMAVGMAMLSQLEPGTSSYLTGVLPGVVVFGFGLSITVGPLTSAVLAAVEDRHLGAGSGINNAVARAAGLLAVAVLPAVAGVGADDTDPSALASGFDTAMLASAALCAVGGIISLLTIRRAATVPPMVQPAAGRQACAHPCVKAQAAA